ncbi:MAG: flagellar protein FlaG [Methylobacter sp.]
MDVLPVFPQPATFTDHQNAGGVFGFVQTAPVVSNNNPVASAASASGAAVAKEPPSTNQVIQAVKQVNNAFTQKGLNLYAAFEKDKITGINIVQIKEKKTNEIIRQLPPQETVAFAQSLDLPEGWRGQWIRNMS